MELTGRSSLEFNYNRLINVFMSEFPIKPDTLQVKKREMCRNIKPLFNFEPPATDDEIRAASMQFVRKVSGLNKPSRANEAAFQAAVEEIASITTSLLQQLETNSPPKDREIEAVRARARNARRFAK